MPLFEQDAPERGRSKEKAMLSGRFSEISQTSADGSSREGSSENTKSALSLEVPANHAAEGEGSRPLSFDVAAHSRKSGPQTSSQAAALASSFALTHCGQILDALKFYGPMGKTRLQEKTGIDHVAIARRLAALEAANLAEPTDSTEQSASLRDERVLESSLNDLRRTFSFSKPGSDKKGKGLHN